MTEPVIKDETERLRLRVYERDRELLEARVENDTLKRMITRALSVGHNEDCLFCGLKDRTLSECGCKK